MSIKPLDRLLFAQGGACFFCRKPLNKAEASVEHLVAQAHGGKDGDENCVACCVALNSLFGRVSLKEKLQIILNQQGVFRCPATAAAQPGSSKSVSSEASDKHESVVAVSPKTQTRSERFELVVQDLQKRGNSKPGTVEKLLNTIKSRLTQVGEPAKEADVILRELQARRLVAIKDQKVCYALPAKDA